VNPFLTDRVLPDFFAGRKHPERHGLKISRERSFSPLLSILSLFYPVFMDTCSGTHRRGNHLVICELPLGHDSKHRGHAQSTEEEVEWADE
jgi:hypothetical protein